MTYLWNDETYAGEAALSARTEQAFAEIEKMLRDQQVKGIAWDGCHKIYVIVDATQLDDFEDYDYLWSVWSPESGLPDRAIHRLKDWYYSSCGLRFISIVTGPGNEGISDLIPQVFTLEQGVSS